MEDNVKIDLKEIGWKGVDWVHMTQDRQAYVMSKFYKRQEIFYLVE
jgi:hypothetical protein